MTKVSQIIASVMVLLVMGVPARAGVILILSSENAAGFHRGQTFDGAREIKIPTGARLVLMDERAIVVTINGPYVGIPGGGLRESGPSFLERLAVLLTPAKSSEDRIVLGATRAFGNTGEPADPWAIVLTGGNSVCARPTHPPHFWRPAPRPASTLNLSERGGGTVKEGWAADQATIPWPDSLPVVDGNTYIVTEGSAGPTRTFVMHLSLAPLETEVAALEWLVVSGCAVQLEAMLASISGRRVVEGPQVSGRAVFE